MLQDDGMAAWVSRLYYLSLRINVSQHTSGSELEEEFLRILDTSNADKFGEKTDQILSTSMGIMFQLIAWNLLSLKKVSGLSVR